VCERDGLELVADAARHAAERCKAEQDDVSFAAAHGEVSAGTGARQMNADDVPEMEGENPTAGGTVFGGYAICGQHTCPNVIVRSDLPPSLGLAPSSPQYLYYVTMQELGHALGLGHGEPLLESTDLMGYGWNRTNMIVPVLSECDLEGIAVVFAWALEGVDPYPPTEARVYCPD
jgi:hypothetical protein